MKSLFYRVCVMMIFAPVAVWAADIVPPAQMPEKGFGPGPKTMPEQPSDPGAPPIPPSSIDPGIERRSPTVPDDRSAVPPPIIDPKMSIDPDVAPPTKGIAPGGGSSPEPKPRHR